MPITLYHIGRSPSQPQFGLDVFIEHFKAAEPADVVLMDTSVPQKGDAHSSFPFMFVTDRYCSEVAANASSLDITYTGCMKSSAGNPVLPPQQTEYSDAVQSASSSRGNDGTILASPVTVEFYAPTKRLNFISYSAKGALGTVGDPTDEIRVIKLTVGDTSYAATGALAGVVAKFFTVQVVDTMDSPEIVAGHFWQNAEIKTKTLSAWIYAVTSGEYIVMYAPGSGYTVGNSLTITDGTHTAAIVVDSVGVGNSIVGFHATANSFNYTTPSPIMASGGSGSGAGFYNYHIP